MLMYKHFIWKKLKETNYLYSIENGNGDCVKETTTGPCSQFEVEPGLLIH